MIERQPHRANQVENLTLNPTPSPDFDKRIICNMFPNLRQVIFLHGSGTYQREYHLDNPFKFEHAVLASVDFPRNVIPTSVTNLDLLFIQADDLHTHTHIKFYNYAAKKYPSATNPLLVDIALIYQDAEYARHVYEEGIFPFYQKVGPRADTISLLAYCNGLNAFQKFNDFGIRIKELGVEVSCEDVDVFVIEELVQSKQAKYIERLSVIQVDLRPIHMILNMEALIYLYIACNYEYDDPSLFTRRTIDFNQLIAACPATLIDLEVDGFDLTRSGAALNLP